ncbi:hypothetical protein GN956_G24505 [Arapaima gigas]
MKTTGENGRFRLLFTQSRAAFSDQLLVLRSTSLYCTQFASKWIRQVFRIHYGSSKVNCSTDTWVKDRTFVP